MSKSFEIQGGKELRGDIYVQGSKNAATKLIAATLLTDKRCTLVGIPRIKDVEVMLEILQDMGAEIQWENENLFITNDKIDINKLPTEKIARLRSSIVLMGPILARFGRVTMPYPGGDKIGARALDTHFRAFEDLGLKVSAGKKTFTISEGKNSSCPQKVILDEFSVTATENLLLYLSSKECKVEILITAEEPHIQNLVDFLNKMGAKISILPSHKIFMQGAKQLNGAKQKAVPDYIEAGTFVAAALVVGGNLTIHNFPTEHLELLLQKLKRAGANITVKDSTTIQVKTSNNFKLDKIQTLIYPGVPTDLQSPLGVLATQSKGETLIHDPMYEGRLTYLSELQKMGAKVKILDPHRAVVTGPTKLKGAQIEGRDIRGGMSLIIAALAASGKTILKNTYQVDRGYEKIDERLRNIGAQIKRI